MTHARSEVVICGAGMAGVAAAYHLVVRHGVADVVLVDERPPLTLTSDKGTQAYRNWWPGPDDTMVRFTSRSIDLLEELARAERDGFGLNRRGYVFLTADPERLAALEASATEIAALGAGPVRRHTVGAPDYVPSSADGFDGVPDGADLIADPGAVRRLFPFVTDDVVGMLHVRRAGWFDSNRLGHRLLQRAQARPRGLRLVRDRVEGVSVRGGRVGAVRLASGAVIETRAFVIAAGPHLARVAAMLALDVPVFNELHAKLAFEDPAGVVPRDAPLLIWDDPVPIEGSDAARAGLPGRLRGELPPGVHLRPRGANDPELLGVWTYDTEATEPVWPPAFDAHYGETLLLGLARMIPGLGAYAGRAAAGIVDGGYYCKTRENRPLVGPLPFEGAYVVGALSGYGIMASQAAGELLAAHVTGAALPAYAPAFLPSRYDDPAYRQRLSTLEASQGQL